MPIGLEVNDYDSEADVSSTEDDNLNLPVVRNKNKKVKTKKKTEKKSILKESKIVKDKAKKKIKSMESEVKDINSVNYLNKEEKTVTFGEDEIREFYTDAELADQIAELKKLEATQKKLWKYAGNTHVAIPKTEERGMIYSKTMPSIFGSGSSMFSNLRKAQTNSRTRSLNSSSRVNTSMPLMSGSRIINRSYNNIGKMW